MAKSNNWLAHHWFHYCCCLVAGVSITLSLAPFNYWLASILGIALLYISLNQQAPRAAFLRGWLFGLGLFGSGTSWIYVSIAEFGNTSPIVALLLMVIFTAGIALFPAIPFAIIAWLQSRFRSSHSAYGAIVNFSVAFLAGEWLRSWLLTGFPWLYVGYAFIDTPLAAFAPVGGVWMISLLVTLAAAFIGQHIIDTHHYFAQKPISDTHKNSFIDTLKRCYSMTLFILISMGVLNLALSYVEWVKPKSDQPIEVAIVQANIAQKDKWVPENYWLILNRYYRMTENLFNDHQIVVWPESSLPAYSHQVEDLLSKLNKKAGNHNSALLIGLPVQSKQQNKTIDYNSVLALGAASGQYNKQHLVPFGEYLPLKSLLGQAVDFMGMPMANFSSAESNQPLIKTPIGTVATAICYEIIYADLVRKTAGKADFLLTVSNDAWFGNSIGPKQHMQMARMRALENGRYLLRSTGTGITAIVSEKGKVTASLPQFKKETLSSTIVAMQGLTPFSRWGQWPLLSFIALLYIILTTYHKLK